MSRSVRVFGWSTILISIIIIFSELVSLLSNPMEQFNSLFSMFPQARKGIDSMIDLFQYSRLWSIYTIFYFIFVLIGAIQFVSFRAIGRTILEVACWIGIVNACADSLLSYMLMKKMQTAMSSIMGNMGIGNTDLLGMAAIIIGFFLWIIPSIGMIVYLRRQKLRMLMKWKTYRCKFNTRKCDL